MDYKTYTHVDDGITRATWYNRSIRLWMLRVSDRRNRRIGGYDYASTRKMAMLWLKTGSIRYMTWNLKTAQLKKDQILTRWERELDLRWKSALSA